MDGRVRVCDAPVLGTCMLVANVNVCFVQG